MQVSRLGHPLVNEVVIPLQDKDRFNATKPPGDGAFLNYVTMPEFPGLLNLLYGISVPATPRCTPRRSRTARGSTACRTSPPAR